MSDCPRSGLTGHRLVRAVLRLVGGSSAGRRLAADLIEEYDDHQRPARGRIAATLWLWGQVLRALPHLALRRGERWIGGGGGIGSVLGDARYALRRLAGAPIYTVAAVLTLALGIGANTALFSVVKGVVLRPLPYAEPDEIYRAWAHADDGSITDFSFRVAEFRELLGREGVIEAVGADFPATVTVEMEGTDPVRLPGLMISAGYFDVFGVVPVLGRTFTDDEVAGGEQRVAVLSNAFWQTTLGADPEIVGKDILVNGAPYRVTGILPADFRNPSDPDVAVYYPYTIGTSAWIARWLALYVRVGPESSPEAATEEIDAVMAAIAAEGDGRSRGWHATLQPLDDWVVGEVRRTVWILFASVVALLLIACVNVANLALARAATRSDEIGLRRALGAGRRRVIRLFMAESLMLAAIGGLAGTATGWFGLRLLLAFAPSDVPRLAEVTMDPGVLLFTAVVTLGTGLLFGLMPALRAAGGSGSPPLVAGARGAAGRRTQPMISALVVAEVALTMTLVVGAGLLSRTVRNLHEQEMGFDRASTLSLRVALPSQTYRTVEALTGYLGRARSDLAALPEVETVGSMADGPLTGQGPIGSPLADSWLRAGRTDGVASLQRRAGPGAFEALGVRVLAGRVFDGTEQPGEESVVVLSESLAEQLFPGENAVGRRIGFNNTPEESAWSRVIGIAADVQYISPDAPMEPQYYQSLAQSPVREMTILVKTSVQPQLARPAVLRTLREIDPGVPIYQVESLAARVDASIARQAFAMLIFSLFAGVAVLLTLAGVYGVLAFSVAQRRQEIGVRMALGAPAGRVVGGVVSRAARLALLGVPLGLVGAVVVHRMMESLLFGVDGFAVDIAAATTAGALSMAIVASWLPAHRAAQVDPGLTLREE